MQTSAQPEKMFKPWKSEKNLKNFQFKVLLRRKYTFSNLSRNQNYMYITQIVVVQNLKSKFQREVR